MGLNAQPVRTQNDRPHGVWQQMAMKSLRVLTLVQCRRMGWKFATGQGTQTGPGTHTRTITYITSEITNIPTALLELE
jgi:hypothetical protein